MDQYHAAVLISTRFAEIEKFWLASLLFFSFSVLSNLAEISSCVNMSSTLINQFRPYLSENEVNDISIDRPPVSYTWGKNRSKVNVCYVYIMFTKM